MGESATVFQSKKQRIISCGVFGIYLVLLTWLVLFKFAVRFSDLPNIQGINLIPFYYDKETSMHLKEVVYNVIVFVPLGVYIQIFLKNRKAINKILTIFLIGFLFETVQFIFAIGASDITDLIGNTTGGFIGIHLCVAMQKIFPKKFISIINVCGLLIEIGAVGLRAILLVANS